MTRSKRFTKSRRRDQGRRIQLRFWMPRALGAAIGGVIAAIAWLPPHHPVFVALGLATILYATRSTRGWKEAAFIGFVGSVFLYAVVSRPLVSAYVWGGWTDDGTPAVGSSPWWLLNTLWILLSLWGALLSTVVLTLYWQLRTARIWIRVLGVATLWAGIAEGLRSVSLWGFEWGFLGVAVVDIAALRQWSSVGGVLLLSSLVVGASALLVEFLTLRARQRLAVGAGALIAAAVVWLAGDALEPGAGEGDAANVRVAAFQFAPAEPPAGTTTLGLSPDWFSALRQIVEREIRLIVLPETVASHAIQLDGVPATNLGAGRQVHADLWTQALTPLLQGSDAFLVIGAEGAEGGATHNSTAVWSERGLVGWQHKVRLVPFAEYLPRGWPLGWRVLGSQSLTHYQAGERYRPIDAGPFRIGSFICQEVQHSGTTRELTRRGANILVTGGNDGVFRDRRVAEVHHSMARIRAAEVGRHIVRAMKNGVTSIIGPSGEVMGRSPGEGPALVVDTVSLKTKKTLWTRVGAWPLFLGTLGFLGVILRGSRRNGSNRRATES